MTLLRWMGDIVAIIGSSILLLAAFAKFQDLGEFRQTMSAHGLLQGHILAAAAIVIPLLEAIVGVAGIAFCAAQRTLWSVACCAAIYMMFAAYAAVLTVAPPPEPVGCGCGFSQTEDANWPRLAVRNAGAAAILLGVGLIACRGGRQGAL